VNLKLCVSVSAMAVLCGAPGLALAAEADTSVLEELVVTAQKREESLQKVPIAVSAFNQDALKAQRIDGGVNLVNAVPNLTYTRRALSSNFQIRGIGAQLFSVSGDDGVGVHHNNVPLTTNRLFDADFYDVERVEVLRGPQGTLYGRNATGGVVNVITNKPTDSFEGSLTAEFGNYNSRRFQGFVNVPLGDMFAVRAAVFSLNRDGYTTNLLTGGDLDGRDVRAGRVTLSFRPSDRFQAFLLWDGFREDDTRGPRKQLCKKDPGLTSVLGVPTGVAQAGLTQGCLPATVYDPQSYGTSNTLSTFSGILGRQLGIQTTDAFAGKTVSRDLRAVEVVGTPVYRPHMDLYELNLAWKATPELTLTSLTSYNKNVNHTRGDTTGGYASVPFPVSARLPTGALDDPQLGLADRFEIESGVFGDSDQWTQEFRAQSDFAGPLNFNAGGIYVDYERLNFTYVAANLATAAVRALVPTAYIDPLREPDLSGHNYFVSRTEYKLRSKALFGEVYWQATDTLRLTVGLRYTDDHKWTRGSGSTLFTPGRGPTFSVPQTVDFKETTGRVNLQWSPDLGFTESTIAYASYARGYKGGGFNPPGVIALGLPSAYAPEFVDAYEVGTKNTLLHGTLQLNLTAFYYDYQGYQIGRSVNKSIFNENIDATIKGVEFESVWAPVQGLRLNANAGYLDTRIKKGVVVDSFNRTQGDPAYVYGNSTTGGCIVRASGLAAILAAPGGPAVMADRVCSGPASVAAGLVAAGSTPAAAAALAAGAYSYGANVSLYSSGAGEGVRQDLAGNQLPNAPKWTLSLGAQYRWELPGRWSATLRGDYYRQARSFARNNNAFFDRIRAWENINASLIVAQADDDLEFQLFVKNLRNKDTIVGFEINDENVGALRNVYVLDPRLYGVSVTKRF
jgi:outer membrane receptor protein involved in Fe transport